MTLRIDKDIAIAKKICEGLRSGEKECLGELVTAYNEFFSNFARPTSGASGNEYRRRYARSSSFHIAVIYPGFWILINSILNGN